MPHNEVMELNIVETNYIYTFIVKKIKNAIVELLISY